MSDALLRFAESFCFGMLVHLWQTTIVLALLWLLARALRNAPARLQAGLWWIAVLKLFLPLSLLAPATTRFVNSVVGRFHTDTASPQVEWISATFWLYPVTQQTAVETSVSGRGMFCLLLMLFWFAGLGWILFRRLQRAGQEERNPLRLPGAAIEGLEAKLSGALAPTGIPREVVLFVRGCGMPAVRGLLRPRIELPTQVAERLAVFDLAAVLLHEEEHRRRRDPLRQVLAALASWLFFFYLPLRWVLRRVYETTEMACDEAVLRCGIEPRDYARSIARTLELGLGPADVRPAFIGPGRSSLRRRLARLNLGRRYRTMPLHRIILVIAGLIVLLGSVVPFTPGTEAASEKPAVRSSGSRFVTLDRLASAGEEVTLTFNETSLRDVLDALSRVAGFKLVLDSSVSNNPVTISLEHGTVSEALIRLAELSNLSYLVPDPTTLRVRGVLLPGVDGVTAPRRIEDSPAKPVYPEEMRKAKLTGRVVLQAVIDSRGTVKDVEVLSSDHPSFSESAIAALTQWRYQPATLDGEPVDVYFTIVVKFELNGDKQEAKPLKPGQTI